MKIKIHITLKKGVLDPQGKAIEHALAALGFTGVSNVRQGKYIELDVDEVDEAKACCKANAMCRDLLANAVIENFLVEPVTADIKH